MKKTSACIAWKPGHGNQSPPKSQNRRKKKTEEKEEKEEKKRSNLKNLVERENWSFLEFSRIPEFPVNLSFCLLLFKREEKLPLSPQEEEAEGGKFFSANTTED